MRIILSLFCFFGLVNLTAQTGSIEGRIFDPVNNESIPFANVVIQGTSNGTTSDVDGNYKIDKLEPGLYNLQVSYIGYKTVVIYEIQATNSRPAFVDIEIEPNNSELEEVVIKASPFSKTEESPVSLRSIGADEIKRNPGGNRDISKAIQSLPGVASTASFRNDILIRGGSPAENTFYIDGIEIPTINHFSTQGASGGPVGMINVDFVKEVDFFAGAFPSNRGNALSSVFDFKFIEGNPKTLKARFTLGSSDAGLTLDGPLGKKTNFIFSARQSYLQFLFDALELSFLPTYTDSQLKIKTKLNDKNTLLFFGIGALDDFELNLDANETEEQQYQLDNIPVNDQWNYTMGVKYTNFRDNSYTNFIVSRSHFNNGAYKYLNNDESSEDNLLLDYESNEIENKIRVENISRFNGYKLLAGLSFEAGEYNNNYFQRIAVGENVFDVGFNGKLNVNQWGGFAQISKSILNDRLSLSAGLRLDAADYSDNTNNMFEQISPRLSFSYKISDKWNFNANTGIYYQLPSYTLLGYEENGSLINKENGLKYIKNTHYVAGLEWNTASNTRFTLEGFFKDYENYPFLINDSISFANVGGDFGVVGNEPANSSSKGQTYGLELLAQQKLFKGVYGILAYTFSFSEFEDKNGKLRPTSWDSRHIVNVTGGYRFGKNWELGVKWRFATGSPYTPYDEKTSALIPVWDGTSGFGQLDYSRLNEERLDNFHSLDFRLDKKFFYNKWTLQLYLDIQNAYNTQFPTAPVLIAAGRDETGTPLVDPSNAGSYQLKYLENSAGNLLPSIGFIVEL